MGINRQSIPDSDPLFSITIVPVELVLGRDDFSNKCLRAVLVARIVAVIVDAMGIIMASVFPSDTTLRISRINPRSSIFAISTMGRSKIGRSAPTMGRSIFGWRAATKKVSAFDLRLTDVRVARAGSLRASDCWSRCDMALDWLLCLCLPCLQQRDLIADL